MRNETVLRFEIDERLRERADIASNMQLQNIDAAIMVRAFAETPSADGQKVVAGREMVGERDFCDDAFARRERNWCDALRARVDREELDAAHGANCKADMEIVERLNATHMGAQRVSSARTQQIHGVSSGIDDFNMLDHRGARAVANLGSDVAAERGGGARCRARRD